MLAAMGAISLLVTGVALGAVLQGTHGGDGLNGTTGPDVLYGYGGNDTILGMAGNDVVFGGRGNDGLDSTPSAVEGVEAPGMDVYFGARGNDTVGSWADEVTETGRSGTMSATMCFAVGATTRSTPIRVISWQLAVRGSFACSSPKKRVLGGAARLLPS